MIRGKWNNKVLVVDSDGQSTSVEREFLEKHGFNVTAVSEYGRIAEKIAKSKPELILLDLASVDETKSNIRDKMGDIPVIVMSDNMIIDDTIVHFLGRVEDYVTKPVKEDDLVQKVEFQLKKSMTDVGVIQVADIVLNCSSLDVSVNGNKIHLTKTEYAILKVLMMDAGHVLEKEEIVTRIAEDTLDCTVSSLKTHVSHLRAKLRSAGNKEYIVSIWGIGFKFMI